MKSNAEKLLDLLAKLAESETVVTDGINDAYQLAGLVSCELEEEYEKVDGLRAELAEAVAQAAIGRRAVEMLVGLEWSYGGDAFCPHCAGEPGGHEEGCKLGAILRDAEQANSQGILDSSAPEQANNRVILDSSDHVPGVTKMATDRQLADAVNELRDIAIKYHSAGQLRERIAGVVSGLVRGEPSTVAVDALALDILRAKMFRLDSAPADDEFKCGAARIAVIEAARRLLARGGQ